MSIWRHRSACVLMLLLTTALLLTATVAQPATAATPAATAFEFGFAKSDITPTESLRLSGYGNRIVPAAGVDTPLSVRAMAIKSDTELSVLVALDTIGLPGALVHQIAERVNKQYGVPRPRFVVCFTHSHTAPHITNGLTNIFSKPLTQDEQAGAKRYTDKLEEHVVACVGRAIKELAPGTLHYTVGQVTFAENRRLLKDGKWVGFGVNPQGPVDHTLPLLTVTAPDGTLRGLVFNYACHCTTYGGDYNRINGDWAGYAAQYLEAAFPDCCAMGIIGCGADANPPRDAKRATQFAEAEGKEILNEVKRLVETARQPITRSLSTRFGTAALPFDKLDMAELKTRLVDGRTQTRQHAQNMLELHSKQGQLPESYAAPIHVWKFGDELCMVFLSGEVVVDYALRLKRELAPKNVWVTAYADDLFAYIASERLRQEGGYEVDGSMIYYNQPGRWATGTEEILMRRIHQLIVSE